MKYIIQHSVYYDSQHGTLRSTNNDEDFVQLTRTASKLLLVLLDDRDVMTRDIVRERVWSRQVGAGSYNNLNQYLSILRRTFRQYGLDDFILSIPRVGIQLNPDIKVEQVFDEGDAPENDSATKVVESGFSEPPPMLYLREKQATLNGYFRIYFKYIVPGALLLSLSAFMLIYVIYEHQFLASPFLSTLPVTDCRVNSLEQVSKQGEPEIVEDFLRVRQGLSLSCDAHHHFMFYYDARIKNSGLGKTLLTQCTPRGNNPDGFCNNYFFYNWR